MSLVRLIEHRYGLRGLPAPVSLTGGYTNDPLRMGDVVVRFAPERVTEAELEYEHSLVARLAERVPEVCGPLRDRDGQTWFSHEGRVCSVWPWIPGRRGVRRSRTTRLTAAAVLARIHRAGLELEDLPSRPGQPSLGDLDLRTNWMWSLDDACAVRPDARLEELWMELCDIVAGCREADLVSGVVHSDFYPGNVIAQRGLSSA
ncbi:MAG: phosphotransferase enzyme family protein [Gaiellaceae bacterium]